MSHRVVAIFNGSNRGLNSYELSSKFFVPDFMCMDIMHVKFGGEISINKKKLLMAEKMGNFFVYKSAWPQEQSFIFSFFAVPSLPIQWLKGGPK